MKQRNGIAKQGSGLNWILGGVFCALVGMPAAHAANTFPSSGNTGVGTTAPAAALDVEVGGIKQNNSSESNAAGVPENNFNVNWSPSSASSGVMTGTKAAVSTSSSNASGATLRGFWGSSVVSGSAGAANVTGFYGSAFNASSGTVANAFGMYGFTGNTGTGTITNAAAAEFLISNASGIINNAYGVRVVAPQQTGSGAIQKYYGVYIATPSVAKSNYALYAQGGVSYFGGPVGVQTNPQVALDVAGGIRAGSATIVTGCNATLEGTQRYNYGSHTMEFCNGSAWVGVGNPSGTWCGYYDALLSNLVSNCSGQNPSSSCPSGYTRVAIQNSGSSTAGYTCIKN